MGFRATDSAYKNLGKCEFFWGKREAVLSHSPRCPRLKKIN